MSRRDWRVVLAPAAERELDRLPADVVARLGRPIAELAITTRPTGAAKIVGSSLWRVRVGPVRIVYQVREAERVVLIVRVALRGEGTYRRLGG